MVSRRAILQAAEGFRAKHWPEGTIPVDVELIAEKAGIDIVPAANLRDDVAIDACISADLKSLYVDLQYLMNTRMEFRVRFSIAHELGHLVLHRHVFDEYAQESPKSAQEWAKLIQDRIETPILEREANEFAGCLLVPEPALRELFEEYYPIMCKAFQEKGWDLEATDPDSLRAFLAGHIQRKFEVSAKVIEIRLRACGIVPNH